MGERGSGLATLFSCAHPLSADHSLQTHLPLSFSFSARARTGLLLKSQEQIPLEAEETHAFAFWRWLPAGSPTSRQPILICKCCF